MPIDPVQLSRRAALRTAAVAVGSAAVLAGCDDEPGGTDGSVDGDGQDGTVAPPEPSTDPAVVAALTTAATQVAQAAQRYGSLSQAYPALRTRLAAGVRFRAAHAARLREVGGFEPPPAGKLPPLPKTAAAALADLASREQKLAVAHAMEAAKLSGEPARLMAMMAASESQLAIALTAKKAAR